MSRTVTAPRKRTQSAPVPPAESPAPRQLPPWARALGHGPLTAIFFCILSLSMGSVATFTIPPFQVPDEWAHMLRVVDTASGRCMAQPKSRYDGALLQLARIFRAPLEFQPPLAQQSAASYLANPARHTPLGQSPEREDKPSADLYSCVPYTAAALPWAIAPSLGLTNVQAFYAGRFANLLAYTALTAAALALLPGMRLPLFVLALLPMSLQQAASHSADALTLGLSFLFVALCLRWAMRESPLRSRAWAAFCLLGALLTLCKFNVFLLLGASIVPAQVLGGWRRKALALTLLVGICVSIAALWQWQNAENIGRYAAFRQSHNIDIAANASLIQESPAAATLLVTNTLKTWGMDYLRAMVAALGHLHFLPPQSWMHTLLALLVASALLPSERLRLAWWQRAIWASAFLASLASMMLLLFVFETDAVRLADARAGNTVILGIQGRYLLPIAPLLLFTLPPLPIALGRWQQARLWRQALAPTLAAVLLLSINVPIFAFFRESYASYRKHLIAAGPLDGKLLRSPGQNALYVVARGTRHLVKDDAWPALYGIRLPEDLRELPAADVDAIPEGDPISSFQAASRSLPLPWESAASRYEGKVITSEAAPGQRYRVQSGARHPLPPALQHQGPQPIAISLAEFLNLPEGPPVEAPPGTP